MEMPQVSAGHRRFEQMAGRWVGEERMHPSQWDPEGGVAAGTTTSRVALNGFALIAEYEQERDGAVTFAGHGVYTFDPESELYILHWFDSIGSPAEVFKGRFDGDVLTLTHAGPPMHVRLVYDYTQPGVLTSAMDMAPDGSEWKRLFDARYDRR